MSSSSNSSPAFKTVGIVLALSSGAFIGCSYVFKKKGLLNAQRKDVNAVAGEGHAYLKEPLWWFGMTLMIIGEICNFVAYAFIEAILVTPLGALSVVLTAILSAIFLKEHLTFFGKVGCALCIVGAIIIVLHAPQTQSVNTIDAFEKLFIAPGFLTYTIVTILISLGIVFFVAPKYGKKYMLVYISVCSIIGGISVSCTQGLGAAIVTSIGGQNQFTHWFIYFLMVFVVCTLLTEINYLNKALELFNTAMVTPVYYVTFTTATIIASAILFQGFSGTATEIITVVLGFLTICAGIVLLQMSKAPPGTMPLDRHSSMLLDSSRVSVISSASMGQDPEMDAGASAIRGFGAIGSIRRSKSLSARRSYRQADGEGRFSLANANQRRMMTDSAIPQGGISEADAIARIHRGQFGAEDIPMQEKVIEGLLDEHKNAHGIIVDDRKFSQSPERDHEPNRRATIRFGETSTYLYPSAPSRPKSPSSPKGDKEHHGYFGSLMNRLRHHEHDQESGYPLPPYAEEREELEPPRGILVSSPRHPRREKIDEDEEKALISEDSRQRQDQSRKPSWHEGDDGVRKL